MHSGDQNDSGGHLSEAVELPHPVVQVVGHGDAVNDAGELDSGGRSSAATELWLGARKREGKERVSARRLTAGS